MGFPKQFSGRRPKLLRQPPSRSLPSFWRWGVAGRASRSKFPSDESGGILERQWPQWPFYRTSGQIFKFGLRMADFILSRVRSLSAAKPSHFYQGLAELQLYQGRLAAVAVYQSRLQFYQGRPAYGSFINNGRFFKIEDEASGRNGRFINQKRRICRFGRRFHIAPHKQFIIIKLHAKHLIQLLKLLTKLLIKLLFKLLTKLLIKLLIKLLLKLLIKLLLKLRIRSLDKVHKEDSALR